MIYESYASRILEAARTGRQFRSTLTGDQVEASIITRHDQGTPLNEREAKAFAFIDNNQDFLEKVVEYTREVIKAGHTRWSIYNVIQRARWDWEVHVRSSDDFLLNDHMSPYLSRILNEAFERPFYQLRSVEGEPGHAKSKGQMSVVPEGGRSVLPAEALADLPWQEEFFGE